LLLAAAGFYLLKPDVQAQTQCCNPPHLAVAAARFAQNATVNVYIDANSGFTATEQQMIIEGLQEWNGQSNNSGVTYIVTITSNPPAVGGNNTIVVRYNNTFSNSPVAALTMHQNSGPNGGSVYGEMVFNQNIRNGNPTVLPSYVRETARHEGGHGIGLDNAPNCPLGSTIMNPAGVPETHVTQCDNDTINGDAAYPAPTPIPPSCGANGATCQISANCCDGLCSNGVCGQGEIGGEGGYSPVLVDA
jgi:hypothetical protein